MNWRRIIWQTLHAAIALAGWLGMTIGMMVMGQ